MGRDDLQVSGHQMVTEQGTVVGRVNDVVFDDNSQDDAWAVVSVGLLKSKHFVPLTEAYLTDSGSVVVPYDKQTIKHAPAADEPVMSSHARKELADYYGTSP
jgi:sporulation protein YlmC with PRC-barrel domain